MKFKFLNVNKIFFRNLLTVTQKINTNLCDKVRKGCLKKSCYFRIR